MIMEKGIEVCSKWPKLSKIKGKKMEELNIINDRLTIVTAKTKEKMIRELFR